MFVPNLDLLHKSSERPEREPYIAIFRKGEKILIYIAEKHSANESFDMTDFCFSDKSPAAPQVVLVEFERSGRKAGTGEIHGNNLAYAAARATECGLPVIFADLSRDECLDVWRKRYPERIFTDEDLRRARRTGRPSTNKGEDSLLLYELELYGRDPFMVKNIVAALNKYEVVLAVFGEGHYRAQRLVLEDIMGKPEYIKDVPNTRGDFSNCKIVPIDLGVTIAER
ncbi:MAG: hypothetical protein FWE17_00590 [Alphaproteobacteria bacterium]|nr:hypothetical protein [Alphaproteobacteria bacterium]MCL2758417.1 hypothetical protein [Alphaproteobacteria bacterium]